MARQTYTDAIALLKADHRKVEDLFEKFENARAGSKQKLAEEICNELKIHTIIEEEVFYPALKVKIEDTAALEHLLSRRIKAIGGVAQTATIVVLSTSKEGTAIDLPHPREAESRTAGAR